MDAPFVSQMMTGARLSAAEDAEEIARDDGEDVVTFGEADDDCSGEGVRGVRDAGGAEARSGVGSGVAVAS